MPLLRSNLFSVLLLWLVGLGAAAQFAKVAVPFDTVRALYGDWGDATGWLVSSISLIGAGLGIVAGGLVGRFGARRLVLAGLGLGAVCSLWQATLPAFHILLATRLVEGLSHLAIVVAAPTLIAQLSAPRWRGAAMTLWSTFFGVSFALVAWLAMPLAGPAALARLFAGHGAILLGLAGLVAVFLPEGSIRPASSDEVRGIGALHAQTYRSAHIIAPAAGWLLYTLTFVSLLALLPGLLPAGQAGWAATLMPLVSIAASLGLVPVLLRRVSAITTVVAGFALAAALIALNLLADLQLVFAVTLFAFLGLVQGASFAAIPELNARAQDQALSYGAMAQTGNIGNLLGTPLLLAILSAAGSGAMYATIVALYLCAIVLHLWLARRRAMTGPV
ncbi:MFS transporter [Thalassococcus sp. CAU 1522]|uniref:MFS transporter n=1 Tax=Thalassococcus arenae TaxID=2851652 RepID=A0ABS6N4L9_9RHOB|nr:MFS transporter [Thalassococcus arenae]MBV2358955.1 MFS transporter [Thalassococcus arenae]